jgi:hypothetical protein
MTPLHGALIVAAVALALSACQKPATPPANNAATPSPQPTAMDNLGKADSDALKGAADRVADPSQK